MKQKLLITTPGCPHCADAKKKLADKIKSKEIKVCSASTKKGTAICKRLGINEAPTLVECDDDAKTCKILRDDEMQ